MAARALVGGLVAVALAAAGAGCTRHRACDPGTLAVEIGLVGLAMSADTLAIDVAIAGGPTRSSTIALTAPSSGGSFAVDFAAGYPRGRSVSVAIALKHGGVVLASDQKSVTLDGACADLAFRFGLDGDGGSDGGGGDGGCAQRCGDDCVTSFANDPHHCGTCANDCTRLPGVAPAIACVGGQCDLAHGCLPARAHCGADATSGCETDVSVPAHCGTCANACTSSTPLCALTPGAPGGYACADHCPSGTTQCGTSCVDTSSDVFHCGGCNACTPMANADPTCVGGHCGSVCKSGYHSCAVVCADNHSVDTCGGRCAACPAPTNGVATCDGSSCGVACKNGYALVHGACMHWVAQLTPANNLPWALWGSGPKDIYVSTFEGNIFHFGSDGTWALQRSGPTAPSQSLTALWGSGSHDLYAVGDYMSKGLVLHSTGDGTWTTQLNDAPGSSSSSFVSLASVWGSSAGDIYAVGINTAGANPSVGIIYHSSGDGKWTVQPSGGAAVLRAVWGSGPGDVYAVGKQGTVLHSRGDGVWTPLPLGISDDLNAIWGSSANDVYVVGAGGTIYHAISGSAPWKAQPSGVSGDLRAIWGAGPNDVYAGGDVMSIVYSTGDGGWAKQPTPRSVLLELWGASATNVYAVDGINVLHLEP